MGKQAIHLVLAGSNYNFSIDSSDEEAYRLAEKEVNNFVAEFQKHNIKNFGIKDYLAMTALKLSIVNINTKRSGELNQEDMAQLTELKEQLDDYINSIK